MVEGINGIVTFPISQQDRRQGAAKSTTCLGKSYGIFKE